MSPRFFVPLVVYGIPMPTSAGSDPESVEGEETAESEGEAEAVEGEETAESEAEAEAVTEAIEGEAEAVEGEETAESEAESEAVEGEETAEGEGEGDTCSNITAMSSYFRYTTTPIAIVNNNIRKSAINNVLPLLREGLLVKPL